MLLRLWPCGLQHQPLLLELLRLLDNLLPHCCEARLAAAPLAAAGGGGTLLQQLLALLLPPPAQQQQQARPAGAAEGAAGSGAASPPLTPGAVRAAAATLLHYASTDDGAAALVRPGQPFLADAQRCLRGCVASARREHEPSAQRALQQEDRKSVV